MMQGVQMDRSQEAPTSAPEACERRPVFPARQSALTTPARQSALTTEVSTTLGVATMFAGGVLPRNTGASGVAGAAAQSSCISRSSRSLSDTPSVSETLGVASGHHDVPAGSVTQEANEESPYESSDTDFDLSRNIEISPEDDPDTHSPPPIPSSYKPRQKQTKRVSRSTGAKASTSGKCRTGGQASKSTLNQDSDNETRITGLQTRDSDVDVRWTSRDL